MPQGNAPVFALLDKLASCLDMETCCQWGDDHERWRVYKSAIESEKCRTDLMLAVAADPNPTLAGAVVIEVIRNGAREISAWLELLPVGSRERVTAESIYADLVVMREVVLPGVDVDPAEVAQWSAALQREAARAADNVRTLAALSEHGKTARIRALALDRARQLKRGGRAEGGS